MTRNHVRHGRSDAEPINRVVDVCARLRQRCEDPEQGPRARARARSVAIGAEVLYPHDIAVQIAVARLLLAAHFELDARRVLGRLATVLPQHPLIRALFAKAAA